MCGRYVPPDEAAVTRFWEVGRRNWPGWITPVFNIAPTMQVPIFRKGEDGVYELLSARWGLIPSWWNKPSLPTLSFNARSEEAAEKPMWRHSLRSQRCLMPALGWFEWNENEPTRNARGRKVNQPYFIQSEPAQVIAFAGLWSQWIGPDHRPVLSCALLSRAAAPSIDNIHHRMPVVLKAEHYADWMSAQVTPNDISAMIDDACQSFSGYAVSTAVNDVRNEGPLLLAPLARDDLFK